MKKYSIGLDIGTTSVGWAVVDVETNKIIRKGHDKNKKHLWGVRLFDEAEKAEERRGFRSTRRRYDRRRRRLNLLKKEFNDEINKVDPLFFTKLDQFFYKDIDETNKTVHISNKEKKEIFNKYPTIYHLRERLLNDNSKEDIRLIYMAIHHMIKYRGNFNYTSDNFKVTNLNLKDKLIDVFDEIENINTSIELEDSISSIDFDKLDYLLSNPSKDSKESLRELLKGIMPKYFIDEFAKMISGYKFVIKKMFNLETDDKKSISFKGSDWDDSYIDIENVAGEYISVLSLMKELYDMIYLKSLFNNSQSTSLSGVMVEKYNQHHNDLENIQNIIKPNKNDSDDIKSLRLEEYHKLFKTKKDSKELCIYDQYLHGIKTQDEFCKEVIKSLDIIFDNCKIDSKYLDVYNNMIKDRLITSNFMPKINSVENGKYPYQLNKEEIIKIIENQGEYYPFLKNKVFDSLTNKEVYKIIRLLEFKIPYYVGPLNDSSSICAHGNKNAWMIKSKNNIQITPYNFNEVVDLDASAEKFIKRMTSKCTYLLDKDAIPANSILYSKFKVMNELKQIKVGGQRLDIFIQKDIIKDLFMKTNKSSITVKDLVNYLNCVPAGNQYVGEITGTSALNKFSNNLKSYVDFFGENGIFNETNYLESDAETIIEWVTIFEDKSMLERKIRTQFEKLNENQIKRIMSLKYSGWSELSKELLTEVYYEDKFHNKQNIMELMENTSDNFMQIINSNKYNFQKKIDKINNINNSKQIKYELVDSLATSPANKRGIYQSLKIVKELVKYMGYDPYSISIEMARGEDQIKGRKDSRKESLINIYNENKSNIENFKSITLELKNCDEKMTLKQYLYFTQECRCMYCGKVFDIANLENTDIDHIIPRTLTKDDSIDNKVLVCSDCNRIKSSSFVVPQEYRVKSKARWEMLHKHKLISQKKLYSLSRSYYSDEDIAGFINRQLVETRQVSKHVASILKNIYSNTNINYLHANLSHNYREKYQMYKYRDLNDYHHAHDAYLAAVLGEYQTKIKYANFDDLKKMNQEKRENGNKEYWKYGYAINMTELPIVNDKTGEVLFDPISFNKTVCDTLYNNDIIVTRKTKYNNGALYKQTLYSPDKANVRIKENMPVELYGGYSNVVPSEITLIKTSKENRMVALPTLFINNNRYKKNKKIDYIKNYLKLNDNVEILKDNIPFDTLLIYEGQKCFIKGFSSSHKNFEISNATELLLSKNIQINYKKALNYLFNNINDTTYDYKNDFCVILNYLFSVKEKYPLFIKEIEKIESSININNLSNDQLKTIILNVVVIYKCSSACGSLKEFGLSDRIGRLSGFNIKKGIIVNNSITGLYSKSYEF